MNLRFHISFESFNLFKYLKGLRIWFMTFSRIQHEMMVNIKNKTGKTIKQRGFPHVICSRTWCMSTLHLNQRVLGKFCYVPSVSSYRSLLSASDSGFPEILTPSQTQQGVCNPATNQSAFGPSLALWTNTFGACSRWHSMRLRQPESPAWKRHKPGTTESMRAPWASDPSLL